MNIQDFRTRTKKLYHCSKLFTAVELIIALLIIVGGIRGVVPFSTTPFLLLFGWLMLWLRGVGWRDVGFKRPAHWLRTLLLGVGVGVAYQYLSLYVIEPLLAGLTGELPDLSYFNSLVGNASNLLLQLSGAWTFVAFGEELVYRGYLMKRVSDLMGGSRSAWVASLIVVNTIFGLAHLSQGTSGVIAAALAGLVLGSLYLASSRNIWAPIIAHGVANTVGFTLIFLGKYPGL